jgi:hypothetical protein
MSDTARRRGVARALAVTTTPAALCSVAVLVAHVVAIFVYLARTETMFVSVRALLYPVAWIGLSTYLVVHVWRRGPSVSASPLAVAAGLGYFAVLAFLGGLVSIPGGHAADLRVAWLAPGWGPAVTYGTSAFQLSVLPFKFVGYAALSYGVAAAVAGRSRGAFAGLLGLFSCVGCLLPIVAIAGGVFTGASTALATVSGSYEVGTAVFGLTVVLLVLAVPTAAATPIWERELPAL